MIEPGKSTIRPGLSRPFGLTLGVEEEFVLVDARTWQLFPAAPQVLAASGGERPTLHGEATRYQLEVSTAVVDTAAQLRKELLALRRELVEAASANGCRLVASPSPVMTLQEPLHLCDDEPRQREQLRRYGALTDSLISCGRHIHVGTLDVDTAVRAANRIRPWIPTLIALGANSPFWDGRDTGHASWRTLAWSAWPSAGLPPHFRSTTHYRRCVRTLLDSGASLDTKMVYWDLRPSERWPTLEIRALDMSASVDSAVLQATLGRALVATALRELAEDLPTPLVREDVLRLARWRAAHDGLEGFGLDPFSGAEVPAAVLAENLLDLLAPELAATGDLDEAGSALTVLLRDGSGAHRQRAVFQRRGQLTDVMRHLADETEGATALPTAG
ncbi:glutamate--cysteine ligase [Streptomyces sp. NPDC006879]|uniref:carboxylate-amine ligase n=1 Tax=Streptomyces sp. NPDC006879 TaxID=3364767 RepID=UPI0036CAD172